MAKKKISKKIHKKITKKKTTRVASKKKKAVASSPPKSESLKLIDTNINQAMYARLSGKKLFEKISQDLHGKIGFHILNIFIFSPDDKNVTASLIGVSTDKPLAWGSFPLEKEQSDDILKFIKKQPVQPTLVSFPVDSLFFYKGQKIVALKENPEWENAQSAETIMVPLTNSSDKPVAVLLIALIDSPSHYTKADISFTREIADFLKVDLFYELAQLYQSQYSEQIKSQHSKSNSAQKELKDKLNALESELEQTNQKIAKMESAQLKQLEKIQAEMEQNQNDAIAALNKEHSSKISAFKKAEQSLTSEHTLALESQAQSHKSEYAALKKEYNTSQKELSEKLDAKEAKCLELEEQIQKAQNNKLVLAKAHEKKLEDLQTDRLKIISSLESEKKGLLEKHKQEIESNQKKFSSKIEELTQKYNLDTEAKLAEQQKTLQEKWEIQKKQWESDNLEQKNSIHSLQKIITEKTDKLNHLNQKFELNQNTIKELEKKNLEQNQQQQQNRQNWDKSKQDHLRIQNDLNATISRLTQQMEDSKKELVLKADTILELKKDSEKLSVELTQANNKSIRLENKLEELNQQITNRDATISKSHADIRALEATIETANQDQQTLHKTIAQNESNANQQKLALEKRIEDYQARLNQAQQELGQARASISQLETNQQELIGQKDQAQARIDYLENELEHKAGRLEAQNSELKSRINEVELNLQQSETNYHNEVYQIRQKSQTQTELLQRNMEQVLLEKSNLESEYAKVLQAKDELTRQFESRVEKDKQTIEKSDTRIQNLEKEIEDWKIKFEKQGSLNSSLESHNQSQSRQIQDLNNELEAINIRFEEQIADLNHANTRALMEVRESVGEKDNIIAQLEKEQVALKDAIENKNLEYSNATQKIHQLQSQINNHIESEQKFQKIITESEQLLKQTNQKLSQTTTSLKKSEEINSELSTQLRDQNSKISIDAERYAQMEKNLQQINKELQEGQIRLNEEKRNVKELQESIQSNLDEISGLKQEILHHLESENQLRLALEERDKRIDGIKKGGQVLADLVTSISNLPNLDQKLNFLKDHLVPGKNLTRVTLYQVSSDDQLIFKTSIWPNNNLETARDFSLRVNQSHFAQVLATLKPKIFKNDKQFKDMDLPLELKKHLIENSPELATAFDKVDIKDFMVIPLSANNNINGILIVCSTDPNCFDSTSLELAENISALFSIALDYEDNSLRMQQSTAYTNVIMDILDFKQRRFIRQNNHFHSIISDTKNKIQAIMDTQTQEIVIKESVLQLLAHPVIIPEIREQDLLHIKTALNDWINYYGQIARNIYNMEFNNEIHTQTLYDFLDNIGSTASHMFWFITEGMENIFTHSKAKKVIVNIQSIRGGFIFSIIDNGEGLIRTSGSEHPDKGTGLKALRNMAELMGCSLSFDRDDKGYGLKISLKKLS